jgi:hypothetical protein
MKKKFFGVGLAILVFGLIVLAFWMIPQETKTTYSGTADFQNGEGWEVYEGVNYHMVYAVSFRVEMNDRVTIDPSHLGGTGTIQRFFIVAEGFCGSYTDMMPYNAVVGTSALPAYNGWYHLNIGSTDGYDNGQFELTVTVYSNKQNQTLLIIGAVLLTIGVVVTVYGFRTRKVSNEAVS